MFSKSLLAGYELRGLTMVNPFADTKLKRIPIKAHAPFPRELIENIWKSATMLRNGDPNSPVPTYVGGSLYRWSPAPGGPLTSARAELVAPYGKASSAWILENGTLNLEAVVPPNTTATLVLPGRHTFSHRIQ